MTERDNSIGPAEGSDRGGSAGASEHVDGQAEAQAGAGELHTPEIDHLGATTTDAVPGGDAAPHRSPDAQQEGRDDQILPADRSRLSAAWADNLKNLAALVTGILVTLSFRQPNIWRWTAPVAVAVGVVAFVAASCWAQLGASDRQVHVSATGWNSANWWRNWAVCASCVLGVLMLYAGYQSLWPLRDFGSPYDGLAPEESACANNPRRASDETPVLLGPDGEPIGRVVILKSVSCTTIWAQIKHPPSAALNGKFAIIRLIRDADHREVGYKSELRDGKKLSGGDMLSNRAACVRAEVRVYGSASSRPGPLVSIDRLCD